MGLLKATKVPGWQSRQDVVCWAPSPVWYLPDGHILQSDSRDIPVPVWYRAVPHRMHCAAAASGWYVPAGQRLHEVVWAAGWKAPGRQVWHAVDRLTFEKEPAWHVEQNVAAWADWKSPVEQEKQEDHWMINW